MSFLIRFPADALDGRGESLHQQVMSLFPAVLPGAEDRRRAESNILFLDQGPVVYVRSDVIPTHIPRNVPVLKWPDSGIEAGTPVSFRTVVNAVHRSKRGTRPVDDIDTWIENKLDGALAEVQVIQHERRRGHSGRSPLQVDTIDGRGIVADSRELNRLMQSGIGRAKAYGCGMLLVAR